MSERAWWETLYDERLADVLLEAPDAAEVEATVDFLVDRLGLAPGKRAFDQCCGTGRVAIPLARRGVEVVGVDLCEAYVARARQSALRLGAAATFHVGDAFEFVPDRPCDAAFNWWTSFGYAARDEANARMLRRAFEALAPGARFALDFPSVPGLLRGFQRDVVLRRRTGEGEVVLLRESAVDLGAGVLRKVWTYFLPDGRRDVHESALRLYMPHDLVAMLRGAGFDEVELLGDVRGEPLDLDRPRCIALARRPPA